MIVQLTLNKIINATFFVFAPIFHELNSKIWDFFYVHKRPISPILFTNLSKTVSHHSHFYICLNVFWDCPSTRTILEMLPLNLIFMSSLLFGTSCYLQFKCCLRGQLIRPWNRSNKPNHVHLYSLTKWLLRCIWNEFHMLMNGKWKKQGWDCWPFGDDVACSSVNCSSLTCSPGRSFASSPWVRYDNSNIKKPHSLLCASCTLRFEMLTIILSIVNNGDDQRSCKTKTLMRRLMYLLWV